MAALQDDFEAAGGTVLVSNRVERVVREADGFTVHLADGAVDASAVVRCGEEARGRACYSWIVFIAAPTYTSPHPESALQPGLRSFA